MEVSIVIHVNKFDNLVLIIPGKVNIVVITETKTDSIFPLNQFTTLRLLKPYSHDRNRNRDGISRYVWDIIIRVLKTHKIPKHIIWLAFCRSSHPLSQSNQYFFENIGKAPDKYLKYYDKFLLVRNLILQHQGHVYHNSFTNVTTKKLFEKIILLKMHWSLADVLNFIINRILRF